MKVKFYKYHGTGNDFILIDNRNGMFKPGTEKIRGICHRRFGIGADGLITLDQVNGIDFGMKYYNSDGKESTMCGNGGRCIVAFADFLSLHTNPFRFRAADGMHSGTVLAKDGDIYKVKISMKDVCDLRLTGADYVINTGSPHFIRFLDDLENLDVKANGRLIRNNAEFHPGGINVNFVEEEDDRIFVRTYERGVEDETLSCGTGVTASALAFAISKQLNEGDVSIRTPGGYLRLYFKRSSNGFTGIYLEGPAEKVFEGIIEM